MDFGDIEIDFWTNTKMVEWLNGWETNEWTIILGSKDGCGKSWGKLGY